MLDEQRNAQAKISLNNKIRHSFFLTNFLAPIVRLATCLERPGTVQDLTKQQVPETLAPITKQLHAKERRPTALQSSECALPKKKFLNLLLTMGL